MNCTLDTTVLEERLSDLAAVLYGHGAGEGEVQQALRVETGQLAGRIADKIGPRTKNKAKKQASRAVRGAVNILPEGEEFMDQPGVKYADWTWLYASPVALVGIKNADYQTSLDGESALDFFRQQQHEGPRKPEYIQVGKRGGQHIMQANKGIINRTAGRTVIASIYDKMGELGAAFYNVAVRYVPRKQIPALMVSRMPAAEAVQKSRVTETGMTTTEPAIEFQVDGKGLESNPRMTAKIQRAIQGASNSMAQKLAKIGRGAKYVFETGQVYFEKEEETL